MTEWGYWGLLAYPLGLAPFALILWWGLRSIKKIGRERDAMFEHSRRVTSHPRFRCTPLGRVRDEVATAMKDEGWPMKWYRKEA